MSPIDSGLMKMKLTTSRQQQKEMQIWQIKLE